MTVETSTWIDLGIGGGITRRDPVPSALWSKLRIFHYKKDAVSWAVSNGFLKSSVERRYGRFEYGYVIVSGTQALSE